MFLVCKVLIHNKIPLINHKPALTKYQSPLYFNNISPLNLIK